MRLDFGEEDIEEGEEILEYPMSCILPYAEEEFEVGNFKIPCFHKTSLDSCGKFYVTEFLPVKTEGDRLSVLCRKGDRCKCYDGRLAFEKTKYLSQYLSSDEEAIYAPYGGILCEKTETDVEKMRETIAASAFRTRLRVEIPASRVDMERGCLYLPVAAPEPNAYWRDGRTPVYVDRDDIKKMDGDIFEVFLPDAVVRGEGAWGETYRSVRQIKQRLKSEVASIRKRRDKNIAKGKDV